MILDLDEEPPREQRAYDVCIVGSGPAGGSLARELGARGLRVCVLESGKRRRSDHADRLRELESEGIRIKEYSRERCLGGSSSTWAGLSSPLDEIDLAPRPWLEHSGWPLTSAELAPWYAAAAERYRFPAASMYGPEGFGALKASGDLHPEWRALEEKVFLACSEPQHFGKEWTETYAGAEVDLWLDATLVRLESAGEPLRATAAEVVSSGGERARVTARAFVLATGGIDNARILLCADATQAAGLGNERDQVGRYLMNHPKNYRGILQLERPLEELPYYFGCMTQGFAGYAGLRLTEARQRELELLNSYVRFEPLFPWSDNEGVESLVLLVKRSAFFFERWKKRQGGELVSLRDYSETGDDSDFQNQRKSALEWLRVALNVPLHAPSVAQYAWFRLRRGARPKVRRVRLRNFMEMQPTPENRVRLSSAQDANGVRLARVVHSCTELDKRSLIELHRVLVDELSSSGFGRLQTDLATADPGSDAPWPIDQDASHHMGATRMGTDPSSAVVDPSLRVHGVTNVWCAGASVFPTSGCANPTMTIVALSIRLAEELARRVPDLPAPATDSTQ